VITANVKREQALATRSVSIRRLLVVMGAVVLALTPFPVSKAGTLGAFSRGAATTATATGPVILAQEQAPAPAQVGGIYSSILNASIDDSGACVFSATMSGASVNSAIFLVMDGATVVIAQQGQAAPGGGSFSGFDEVDVAWFTFMEAEERVVVFGAQLQGPASAGIFVWQSATGIQAVALAGQQSPRGKTYQSFAQTNIGAVTTDTGPGYSIASVATMTDGSKAVFWYDSDIGTVEPLATGDMITDNSIQDFIGLSRMGAVYRSCLVTVSGATRTSTRLCTFDHFSVTAVSLTEGKRLPGLGRISSFGSPPSLTGFNSVLLLTSESGKTGLIFAAQLGGTSIIGRSGDHVPKHKEEEIRAFGLPVSVAEYPTSPATSDFPPVSVASVVQLKEGGVGIWFVDFPNDVEGKAQLLATEGDTIGDQGATVGSFSLIKMTNVVTLLFRGTITQGGQSLGALLAFENILGPPPSGFS
jgi:hypothetical protein